jgi:4-hydroxybenzoate polyprenyltransferase
LLFSINVKGYILFLFMFFEKISQYLSFIKFSHTVFAFPFALIGFFWGYERVGYFSWDKFIYVALCMVFARSAAMGFNRWVDREYDAKNSRTAAREIPAGIISSKEALFFIAFNILAFVFCSWLINSICFYLSPVALIVILGYSYTKRFTPLCHLILGLGLGLAPVGAYLAAVGDFSGSIVLLGSVVLCWVSGFDILYALQDTDFDKANKLWSIPALLGREKAIWVSRFLHLCAIIGIILIYKINNQGILYGIGSLLFIFFLIYQHTLVKANDLSKINLAFFTSNGIASIIFGVFVILDVFFE